MKKTKIISILTLILIIGCKSQNEIEFHSNNKFGFEYLKVEDSFEMELLEFIQNSAFCGTKGMPYALLIGKTKSEFLPEKITVLSYCDDRVFNVGENLNIKPTENPTERTTINPIYFIKDTIINGNKSRWVIGSENKAIWGRPIKLND